MLCYCYYWVVCDADGFDASSCGRRSGKLATAGDSGALSTSTPRPLVWSLPRSSLSPLSPILVLVVLAFALDTNATKTEPTRPMCALFRVTLVRTHQAAAWPADNAVWYELVSSEKFPVKQGKTRNWVDSGVDQGT